MNGQCRSVSDIQLRFLCPLDTDIVKRLCKEWFPIKYPDAWYDEITSTNKFYTLVATINDEIIGLIVVEIKPYLNCNYEDLGLLRKGLEKTSRVAYILTLGVVRHYRRHGIATILLNKLIENLTTNPLLEDCKAIYLHVLTTNLAAIGFYEKSRFKRHKFLPLYYSIYSSACDGYSYVLYINGGRPPINLLDCLLWLYSIPHYILPYKWIKKVCRDIISSIYNKISYSPVKYKGHLYTC